MRSLLAGVLCFVCCCFEIEIPFVPLLFLFVSLLFYEWFKLWGLCGVMTDMRYPRLMLMSDGANLFKSCELLVPPYWPITGISVESLPTA
jgi:hypothetical protein